MGHPPKTYVLRGIITYTISPFEQRAFAGAINPGVQKSIRRIVEEFPYVVPPFALAYLIYDQLERLHARKMRKDPSDYENEK